MILEFFAAFVLLCCLWIFYRHNRFPRSFDDVVPYIRTKGPDKLDELSNHVLEGSLLHHLGPKQFRKEQFKRIRLMLECVARRAHDAAALQDWGRTEYEKSRKTFDTKIRAAAEVLVHACTEYCIGAYWVRIQLRLWYIRMVLLPFMSPPFISRLRRIDSFDLVHSYVNIKNAAENLATLCGGDYRERLAEVW